MKKHILKTVGVATLGLIVALPAAAGHRRGDDYFAHAKVVRVNPVYETIQVASSRQVCWQEPRTVYHGTSPAPEIFGAIVGGVIGNQFGHGSGRGGATAAGALLGGAIAHDVKVSNGYGRGHAHTRVVDRCRTEPVYHTEQRVVGYKVKYRYNGRTFWTNTSEHPGEFIRVQVGVRPF